jgi:NAD+--asparagine ADP-ribosyltransferase
LNERKSNSPKRIKAFEPHIVERASLLFKHSMNAKRNKAKLLKQEISETKARLEELNNANNVNL